MNTKPQPTVQQQRANFYRSVLLNYVKDLPKGEIFGARDISNATEKLGHKVPKMYIRGILHGVEGIDQEILNFGKAGGRVCRRGPVETGSRLA